mmetsp:Transcript_16909/g.25580  ORF Transcript_16909/g.25580 Transcript_16909/m.25580 type:complete len:519 (+) Transcript_16909:91-1647(+)
MISSSFVLFASICLLALICCSISATTALPSGSKLKNKLSEDPRLEHENIYVRGAASLEAQIKPESSAISTVDSYFRSTFIDTEISTSLKDTIYNMANAKEMTDFLTTTRRALHRHPEVMYELPFTSDTIASILDELDIPYTRGWSKNTHPDVYEGKGGFGIVAHIGTQDADQPCVILRADMDALPILEATKNIDEFKSRTDNQMHACGHDGHTTMLLGAAALLKKIESHIVGTIRLVFQPAEEGGAGMKRMVEEGLVSAGGLTAQYGFGLHVWPTLPSGVVATRPGWLTAACDTFTITLHGKGGHAAMPHFTVDPIVAASSLITSIQSIISRQLSPLEGGVISVTAINAGDAHNVIPSFATIKGTIRAPSFETLRFLRDKLNHVAKATASMHGCNASFTYAADSYLPTINDPELVEWSQDIGALVSREGKMRDTEPTMAGEDFAFLADAIPSVFFLLGQGTGGDEKHHIPRTDRGLHHPEFNLDEEVLPIGVELHANVALRSLKKLLQEENNFVKAEL